MNTDLLLIECQLCGHGCRVNRIAGELGVCGAGAVSRVGSHFPHHGEEPPISGRNGSGTIFFSQCSLKCVYCQNFLISQQGEGVEVEGERLAEMMMELQEKGCHNINCVTPTHFAASMISAIDLARAGGFNLPIVYNTSGYDSVGLIAELKGYIDIYLVDMRYASDEMARRYSRSPDYVQVNRSAVRAMRRQAGDLLVENDLAIKGVLIRLLILPNNISGTIETLEYIAGEFGSGVYVSVMSQFYPAFRSSEYPELTRRISRKEYDLVVNKLDELGMENGWVQPYEGGDTKRFAGEHILERG